ncbi:MAG: hypothetical protein ACI3ZQ_05035 [Candidatus Cryptobacteroides sp.]
MNLITDINGKILFLYEMGPIIIDADDEGRSSLVTFALYDKESGEQLLREQYYPDFDGMIRIDIRDIISDAFSIDVPALDTEIQQVHNFKEFRFTIGNYLDSMIQGRFTVNGFSEKTDTRMSDIDFLSVPADFQIPVSAPNMGIMDRVQVDFGGIALGYDDILVTNESGKGSVTRLMSMEEVLVESFKSLPFLIKLSVDGIEGWIKSPVFQIHPGHFHQYLFANRYGGFDNVPMSGSLNFVPDINHETGTYLGKTKRLSSDSENIYLQNSGYLTRKTMIAMTELICSRQIYHLVEGVWRSIVVIESTLSVNSADTLHSFSFKYKYADDFRLVSAL